MLGGKKHQFYVQFLGWVECRGVRGTKFTEPVVNDLRRKQRKWKYAPKLTLQVGKKELKISQDVQEDRKKGKKGIKTVKFPIIPTRDITYAVQSESPVDGSPEDIVACIYLGYVPRTKRYVHAHVYRFDSPATAGTFVRILNQLIAMYSERTRDIERQLISQGEIDDPRMSYGGTREEYIEPHMHDSHDSAADSGSFSEDTFPSGSDDIDPDLQSLREAVPYDSVTEELKHRLRLTEKKEAAPLLLPPKDYDTIARRHGDLDKSEKRRCLNIAIVGSEPKSPELRHRNGSDESGIEIPSPTSSEGKSPLDMSDEKMSAHSSSNGYPGTPPTSARDFVYPPQTPRSPLSPRNSNNYQPQRNPVRRNPSRSSAYSSTSYHSESSTAFSDGSGPTVVYKGGVGHISEIPPDYDSEEPVMRNKKGLAGRRMDLTQSMPAHVIQQELDYGYAVVPKRRSDNIKYSAMPSPREVDYNPRGGSGVRRVNSMYK